MTMKDHFRQCMVELDINLARKMWKRISPHTPQPGSDHEILVTMHLARTQMRSLPLKLRAYSHRWLLDNGYPSALPDELKPKAERLYPKIADSVAIGCRTTSQILAPAIAIVRTSMEDAVLEAYADGKKEPTFVKGRMMEARSKTMKKLFGTTSLSGKS